MNIPVTSGNLLEQFARTLMTSLDGNRDGQLSTTEFTSFLTSVMGGAGGAGVAGVAGDAGPPFSRTDRPRSWPGSTPPASPTPRR